METAIQSLSSSFATTGPLSPCFLKNVNGTVKNSVYFSVLLRHLIISTACARTHVHMEGDEDAGNPFESHLSKEQLKDASNFASTPVTVPAGLGGGITVTTELGSETLPPERQATFPVAKEPTKHPVGADPFADDSEEESGGGSFEEEEDRSRSNQGYSDRTTGARSPERRRKRSRHNPSMSRVPPPVSTTWERVPSRNHPFGGGGGGGSARQSTGFLQTVWYIGSTLALLCITCVALLYISKVVWFYNVAQDLSLGASSAKALHAFTSNLMNNPVFENVVSNLKNRNRKTPLSELGLPSTHPLVLKQGPYELWAEQHNTTSHRINCGLDIAKSTARVLRAAFWNHMSTPDASGIPKCMCMHHLHMDRLPKAPGQKQAVLLYQLCGVYNPDQDQIYMMANPTKSGSTREADVELQEHSVSCPRDHWRVVKRHETVFIDWIDPFTERAMYREFTGDAAYCMQLALEEMGVPGNAHCALEPRTHTVEDLELVMDIDPQQFRLTEEEKREFLEQNTVPCSSKIEEEVPQ